MNVTKDVIQEIKHTFFSHENEEGKRYGVSLFTRSERLSWHVILKLAQWVAIASAVGGFMLYNTVGEFIGVTIVFLGCAFAVYILVRRILPERKLHFKEYEGELINFIVENGLYEEDNGKIVRQIDMSYTVFPRILSVYVAKKGDRYQKIANQLAEPLESALGLGFHKMVETAQAVEYMFRLEPIERYVISTPMPLEDPTTTIEVYDEFKLDLAKNFSTLISGVSGTGKSYLAYYLITRYLAKTINGQHPDLYLIDPKQSDLYILCKQTFMPSLRYGHTNADAFRIVKDFKAELDIRQAEYAEKATSIGSTMLDLGVEPALLVIDEYASLIAGMNRNQRGEFEDMISIIAQKGRQLSMGVLILTQQPRADFLPTNVREQLVNRVCMCQGKPTAETAKMMFGTSDIPAVNGLGVGLYSLDGKDVKTFEAPIFKGDIASLIMPVWEHANLSRKYAVDTLDEKKEPTHEGVDFGQFV